MNAFSAVIPAIAFCVAAAACATTQPAARTGDTSVSSVGDSGDNPDAPPRLAEDQGTSCDLEIALACPDGLVDGCTVGTTIHVCVAAGAAPQGTCDAEVALACADGQIDACLLSPPAASGHLCVVAP